MDNTFLLTDEQIDLSSSNEVQRQLFIRLKAFLDTQEDKLNLAKSEIETLKAKK